MKEYKKLIYLYCAFAFFISVAVAGHLGHMFGPTVAVIPIIFGVVFIAMQVIEVARFEKQIEERDIKIKDEALQHVESAEQMLEFVKVQFNKERK